MKCRHFRSSVGVLAPVAALLVGPAPGVAADDLVVLSSLEVHLGESTTGKMTPTGLDVGKEVAVDEAGDIWVVGGNALFKVTIDPLDVESIGSLGIVSGNPVRSVRAIDFAPDGTLWAIVNVTATDPGGNPGTVITNELWTIDTDTRHATFFVELDDIFFQSLAIADDGTFYTFRLGTALEAIDTGTGVTTPVNPVPPPVPFQIQWLAFNGCGTLYGGNVDLVSFDLATGEQTWVGALGSSTSGGAFLPQPLFQDTGAGGLSGTSGVPLVTASGELVPQAITTVSLTNSLPTSAAFFIVGLTPIEAPFFGGTLVPSPDAVAGPFNLDANGALSFSFRWPDLPSCTRLWWQAWIVDPGAPEGLAASDGLLFQSAP